MAAIEDHAKSSGTITPTFREVIHQGLDFSSASLWNNDIVWQATWQILKEARFILWKVTSISRAARMQPIKDAMIQMSRIVLDHHIQELQHELTWRTDGPVYKAIRKQLEVAEKVFALKQEPE